MVPSSAIAFRYAQSFACLAERCEDNCCQGWRISVSEQRVDAYKRTSPELLNLIASDDEGFRMNQNTDDQCLALQGGRCSIHAQLGEEALPDTCATYPRMNRQFDRFTVQSATMSCPEVSRLILFGDAPFVLENGPDAHTGAAGAVSSHLATLDMDCWASITRFFNEQALVPHRSVHQILGQLCYVASSLEGVPYEQWMASIHQHSLATSPWMLDEGPEVTDQLLQVLSDMLKAPTVPESMRQSVSDAIDIQATEVPERYLRVLKPALREIAHTYADVALESAIKRFIAAEMTRTGFPFISTTSAGRDYGLSLTEWTATLAIRALALRLLLLAHCAKQPATQLTPEAIVDLVYRYCRAANHNPATASEVALRQTMGARPLVTNDRLLA